LAQEDKKLDELSRKLDEVLRRLEALENSLTLLEQLGFLPELMRLLFGGARLYSSQLKALRRVLAAEKLLRQLGPGDEISRCIIEALAEEGPMNISELTRAVRARRGTASRRIIRKRLEALLEKGLVIEVEGFGRKFDINMGGSGQGLAT